MSSSTKRPVHEIRMGAVKAAVWKNDVDGRAIYNVTVQRIYKDDGEWKTTQSFGRDDLPLLAKIVDQAHTWIYSQSGEEAKAA